MTPSADSIDVRPERSGREAERETTMNTWNVTFTFTNSFTKPIAPVSFTVEARNHAHAIALGVAQLSPEAVERVYGLSYYTSRTLAGPVDTTTSYSGWVSSLLR